jgi:hypothetical protein
VPPVPSAALSRSDLGSNAAIAGAVISGLFGRAAGCEVGATPGEAVDTNILNNSRRLECGFTFSTGRMPRPDL